MRITQGQFSFLPELTDGEILQQIDYALGQGWAVAVEYTDDPHPRNYYWSMWGTPMFDLKDAAGVMMEVTACRKDRPNDYIKVLAFDSNKGFESIRMAYIVQRPAVEPGLSLSAPRVRAASCITRSAATRMRGRRASVMNSGLHVTSLMETAEPRGEHCIARNRRSRRALCGIEYRRDAGPAGPRSGRAGTGQDPHPRDRGAPPGRKRPAGAWDSGRAAVAAYVLHRQSGHRQDDGGAAHGRCLVRLKYIRRNHVVTVSRDDLVGQYIGHTAPKTKEVLKKAMGGVLFIDEAYYLYRPENERDYGQEAIEILLQVMEDSRDDLVVILAGYKDRMDTFFRSNPGMASRIAHNIDFPDYAADELFAIAGIMVAAMNYRFDDAGGDRRWKTISPAECSSRALPMRARSATRSTAPGSGWPIGCSPSATRRSTRLALETITAEDIRASRVFSQ
jgi:ribulose bisphosphate carboxylase small subunit